MAGQKLSDNDLQKLVARCGTLLQQFPQSSVNNIWFSDEKIFTVAPRLIHRITESMAIPDNGSQTSLKIVYS